MILCGVDIFIHGQASDTRSYSSQDRHYRYNQEGMAEMSRPPREVAGWNRQCLFTRCEDGFIRNRLETVDDFHWPNSSKGIRLLTGSVLGYHEVSSIHVAVITPAGEEVVGFEVDEIVDQVCKLIKGGCGIVICPDKAIPTGVGGKHELLVRLFRVLGLVAGFSRGRQGRMR